MKKIYSGENPVLDQDSKALEMSVSSVNSEDNNNMLKFYEFEEEKKV